jgi:hypothetical protein
MTALGFIFTLVAAGLLYGLPRRWAVLPLLMGAAYMTPGQQLEIGPLHFSVIRILVLVGFARVMSKGERLAGRLQGLDKMVLAWAAWGVCSSFFHKDPTATLVYMLGLAYDALGLYFLMRILIRNVADVRLLIKAILLLLIPLALEMTFEKVTAHNLFSILGGVPEAALVRNGKVRAQGPFAHALLAGSVGAACMPLAILFWKRDRKVCLLGFAATGAIIMTTASSGAIMTAAAAFAGMAAWIWRAHMRWIRWGMVAGVVALDMVMKDPVYFVLAHIDLTGSSTGWHRARLIQSALNHLDEWWLAGTDYTRHWMPTGVYSSAAHTDITNHYLQMGVWGGLPMMFLFMGILWMAFAAVGRALRRNKKMPLDDQFLIWTLGAILFGHATNFFSVSYFDQSIVFLYFLLACIGSLGSLAAVRRSVAAPPPVTATIDAAV